MHQDCSSEGLRYLRTRVLRAQIDQCWISRIRSSQYSSSERFTAMVTRVLRVCCGPISRVLGACVRREVSP